MDGDARASAGALPAWAEGLFSGPLIPVEDAAGRPTPVWAIAGVRSAARVSEQFTANAGEYHARYAASGHFEGLFRQALEASKIAVPEAPLILDLGSGSGANSVVPCFGLFPGARQVATDLSADLLAILADYAREDGLSDRVVCVVMDAMTSQAAACRFDLVTGASILHHLVQHEKHETTCVNSATPRHRPFRVFRVFRGSNLAAQQPAGRPLSRAGRSRRSSCSFRVFRGSKNDARPALPPCREAADRPNARPWASRPRSAGFQRRRP